MFTPKNIQGALEELYDLCDPDYMVDMLVNYSEEFDDISPALLAKSFQKNAEMVSEYRVLSSAGEGIDYQGKVELPIAGASAGACFSSVRSLPTQPVNIAAHASSMHIAINKMFLFVVVLIFFCPHDFLYTGVSFSPLLFATSHTITKIAYTFV